MFKKKKKKSIVALFHTAGFNAHLVSSQVECSETIPGQSGRTQAFEHQAADMGLVSCTQICNTADMMIGNIQNLRGRQCLFSLLNVFQAQCLLRLCLPFMLKVNNVSQSILILPATLTFCRVIIRLQ